MVSALERSLCSYIRNSSIGLRFANGIHRDVAIESLALCRLRKLTGEPAWTGKCDLRPGEKLHSLIRFDPGSAAAGPPAAVMDAKIHSQPVRLFDGELNGFAPLLRHHGSFAIGNADIYIEDLRAAYSDALHRLQIR